MRLVLVVLFSLTSSSVYSNDACIQTSQVVGNTHLQTGQYRNGDCFINLKPMNSASLVYRQHIFNSYGNYMVFNSFGYGPSSQATGSRVFTFVPQKNRLEYGFNGQLITVFLTNGAVVYFDSVSTRIYSSVGLTMVEDSIVDPYNNGGVEIYPGYSFAYLDFGFKLGESPRSNMASRYKYTGFNGQQCVGFNNEVLYRTFDDIEWKFKNPNELFRFLENKCI